MLRINIPSTNPNPVTVHTFEDANLPSPPNGTDTEINGDVILLFEDEEQAVAYLDSLQDYASGLEDDSPVKDTVNVLATAINNDEFVQGYLS